MQRFRFWLLAALVLASLAALADAQPPRRNRKAPWDIEPTPETERKVNQLIDKVYDVELTLNVKPNISRIIRTKRPILRVSIQDPSVVDIIQYGPTEFDSNSPGAVQALGDYGFTTAAPGIRPHTVWNVTVLTPGLLAHERDGWPERFAR